MKLSLGKKGGWEEGILGFVFVSVLVLARIELIFILVAGTVLCFGFSVRILLITR